MSCKVQYKLPEREQYEQMVDGIWEREYYTNHGPLGIELEGELKKLLGVKHVVCMTNLSIAMMIAILAIKEKKKAIIPALSHINVAQSLVWAGMDFEFCDIRPTQPTLDVDQLKKSNLEDVDLVIALNPFGLPADIEKLEEFTKENDIRLMFLSNAVFGQRYKDKKFGHFGDLEIFSFDQSQVINAGEGACITTNDDHLAAKLRNIRSSYGAGKKVPIPYTGNGRMSEIQAGLALLSLNDLEKKKEDNKARFKRFYKEINGRRGISIVQPDALCSDLVYSEILFQGPKDSISKLVKNLDDQRIGYEDFNYYGRDVKNKNRAIEFLNFNEFADRSLKISNNQIISESQLVEILD